MNAAQIRSGGCIGPVVNANPGTADVTGTYLGKTLAEPAGSRRQKLWELPATTTK